LLPCCLACLVASLALLPRLPCCLACLVALLPRLPCCLACLVALLPPPRPARPLPSLCPMTLKSSFDPRSSSRSTSPPMTQLDEERVHSMADEGGAAGALMEAENQANSAVFSDVEALHQERRISPRALILGLAVVGFTIAALRRWQK
jgi:hypothetical protein